MIKNETSRILHQLKKKKKRFLDALFAIWILKFMICAQPVAETSLLCIWFFRAETMKVILLAKTKKLTNILHWS